VIVVRLRGCVHIQNQIDIRDRSGARLAFVHVTAPVPPTMGVVQVHPAGACTAWKVVFAGVDIVKLSRRRCRSLFAIVSA